MATCLYQEGSDQGDGATLSIGVWEDETQWLKVETREVQAGYKEQVFPMRASRQWRKSSREAVKAPLLEAFKSCLHKDLSNLV